MKLSLAASTSVLAAFAAGGVIAAAAWAQAETVPAAPAVGAPAGQTDPNAAPGAAPGVGQGAPGATLQPVNAQPALPPLGPPLDPADPWMWGDVATLRGLDKVTAETRDFEARVGEDVQFFALTVSVKRCAKRPPERQPEVIVGMEVHDRQTDGAGGEAQSHRIFSGWMFGSSPALNPLEHPVYDVWVLDCVDSRIPPPPEVEEAAAEEAEPEVEVLPGQVFD